LLGPEMLTDILLRAFFEPVCSCEPQEESSEEDATSEEEFSEEEEDEGRSRCI